ncbi:hypothetical protein GHK86_02070 [Acidimicrobiaceae bacterium USS-CC1]|uniref:Uncharacterized protein n=1 Tax=Acidiferrimicrobium australe TaxID=2664430 RepID=A0ABW9QPE5_9ACTN|nr:hypothetical protein [Acidiferrimicrobium australe]
MDRDERTWLTVVPATRVASAADLAGWDLSALLAELTRVGRRVQRRYPAERIEVVAHGPRSRSGRHAHFHFTHAGAYCTADAVSGRLVSLPSRPAGGGARCNGHG